MGGMMSEEFQNTDLESLYLLLYNALSPNYEIDSEGYRDAAAAILESAWLDDLVVKAWVGGQDVVMRELGT